MLANIERGLKSRDEGTANLIRSKIVNVLNKKMVNMQNNLSPEARQALMGIRNDDSTVISKADKGNCTVIMDKEEYEKKMYKLLDDDKTSTIIEKDLTKKY